MITHVAVKFDGITYALPKPNRHHHVLRMLFEQLGHGINGPHSEGFLDETGHYMNRRNAFDHATRNGQVLPRTKPGCYQGDELFSEDLW